MENCKPSSIPGTGLELSTEQPAETLLNTDQTQRYQAITGSVMYLAQITRYDVMYAICQLARAMSKPSKAHMGAPKQLLRYLAGTTDFSIVYKRGGFKLSALPLYIDNTATLHVLGNQAFSSRTKHIALRYFYVRELVTEGAISIHYIPTELQLADIGTKFLNKHRLRFLIESIKKFGEILQLHPHKCVR